MAVITKLDEISHQAKMELVAFLQPFFPQRREKTFPAGGGGSSAHKLLVCWGGSLPTLTGNGVVWRVPYNTDGSTFTFSLARAFARLETPSAAATTFRLEKSPGTGVFTPTTITTLTILATGYEVENTALSGSVVSGNLIRLVYALVGGTNTFEVELIGTE